ncbi:hypothetical protein COBT_000155 [Conglomerata obtusa]
MDAEIDDIFKTKTIKQPKKNAGDQIKSVISQEKHIKPKQEKKKIQNNDKQKHKKNRVNVDKVQNKNNKKGNLDDKINKSAINMEHNDIKTNIKKGVKKELSKDDFDIRGMKDASRKYTEDGFPIYTLEELNIGTTNGNTEDCPLDCDCCH